MFKHDANLIVEVTQNCGYTHPINLTLLVTVYLFNLPIARAMILEKPN